MFELKIVARFKYKFFFFTIMFSKVNVFQMVCMSVGKDNGKVTSPTPPGDTNIPSCLKVYGCHAAMVGVLYMRNVCRLRI